MTQKVLTMTLIGSWYHSQPHVEGMCPSEVQDFLDVGDEFELHFANTPPDHDEYYVIRFKDGLWRFADGEDQDCSPWASEFDKWANSHFDQRIRLYVWAMG